MIVRSASLILLSVAFLVTAFWAIQSAIGVSFSSFEKNEAWVRVAGRGTESGMTAELFEIAVRHGVIRYNVATDRIEVLTPREVDAGLHVPLPGVRPRIGLDETVQLIWRGTGAGAEIKRVVDRYLAERSVVAVRSSGVGVICPIIVRTEEPCESSRWNVALDWAFETAGADAPTIAGGQFASQLDNRVLSRFSIDQVGGFGPWTIASQAEQFAGRFRFVSPERQAGQTGPVYVDLLGRNLSESLPGLNVTEAIRLCWGGEGLRALAVVCPSGASDEAVIGMRYVVQDVLPGSYIVVEADAVAIPILSGQRAELINGLKTTATILLNDQLSLQCSNRGCLPVWRSQERVVRAARDLVADSQMLGPTDNPEVAASALEPSLAEETQSSAADLSQLDSEFLTLLPNGRLAPSERAQELQLSTSIGLPDLGFGTYLGFLETLPPGVALTDMRLTFDADLQEIVLENMDRFLRAQAFSHYQGTLLADFDDHRRAAFVLMDIRSQETAGSVLASVGFPFFDESLSAWDLKSLDILDAAESPLTPVAWRGLNSDFTPGSSFKVLSAVALIRSALGQTEGVSPERSEQIQRALLGLSRQGFLNLTGVDLGLAGYQVEGLEINDSSRRAPIVQGQNVVAGCGGDRFGLCHALGISSNIWFASMAMFENEFIFQEYDSLRTGIEQFGELEQIPNRDFDLFSSPGQALQALGIASSSPLILLDNELRDRTGGVPTMEPPNMDSMPGLARGEMNRVPTAPAVAVATNAYGQAGSVTALAMATLSASIARNEIVSPYIARQVGSQRSAAEPLIVETALGLSLREELRRGMAAVPRSGGTAANQFSIVDLGGPSLQSNVFGKTGTATLAGEELNGRGGVYSSWFVGWTETDNGQPQYAFACAISHLSSGGACAAITARILADIEAAGR